MADESDGRDAAAGDASWWRSALEVVAITAIFAAAGAWPVPDVNETVYLTKARHAADPAYAAGDFFLETPDAHGVFYLLLGPLAATAPALAQMDPHHGHHQHHQMGVPAPAPGSAPAARWRGDPRAARDGPGRRPGWPPCGGPPGPP